MIVEDMLDTARLIAVCRAIEHESKCPRLRDPYARRLAGKRGEEILRALPPGVMEVWPIAVRTHVYDEILMRTIEQHKVDTVLNLGAGLDTRPYRLPLPSSLHWIEVDRSEVLVYKEELLSDEQPACDLERVPLNITNAEERQALLERVGKQARCVFVLSEGLLIYLQVEQVAALATDLYAQPALRWWLTEFVSEPVLRRDGWNEIATECTKGRFTPPGGTEFFALHGWKVAEFRQLVQEALRIKVQVRKKWRLYLLALLQALAKQEGEARYAMGGFFLFERNSTL
jgi:methyltransferase (TIGR00027 family)